MTPESFSAFMHDSRQRVEAALDRRLPEADDDLLTQAMRYALLNGGKRVRPLLVYAGAAAIGDVSAEALDQAACALEAIHAYSLVHDDLPAMDNDELRRGQPTCHIAFGEANAILAGDALQTLAFEWLAQCPDTRDGVRLELVKLLAQASGAQGMVRGQFIDLSSVNRQLTLRELETMHRHKTGALIRAGVAMGACLAGADNTQHQALNRYADAIGLAFQVQDDILDVTADTQTLGKQQGADIARNKPTYVSLLGLDGAQAKARELLDEAHTALADFDQRADPLRALASYIVERTR